LPLQIDQELRLEAQKTSLGTLDREAWRIEALGPNESATLDAALIAGINTGTREKTVEIAPRIQIDDRVFAQQPDVHVLVIEHPEISLSATWEDEATALAPGDTKTLHIRLTNTSNTHFENISVSIPVDSSVIDIARLRQLNQGIYSEGRWRTTHNYAANLAALAPGQSTNLDVRIPIRSYPQGGVDLRLSLPTQIGASVSGVDGATYEASAESPTIRIGSNIFLGAEARYYTNEGDQLGRGPLPPQVGKETKYWAMFTISNGTSRATDLQFSAKLAPHVEWTGRSSVSHGKNVSFNPSTRTVSWSHNTLAPQEQAGIYFELALTPSASQIGAHPTLVQNIALSAYDTYTENQIQTSAGAIDTSIPNDSVGRQKGTAVR
jgi:hypothetical protein